MSVLARSTADKLAGYWQDNATNITYQFLRKPERGLVMVQGRAGGTGQRFNLGEMTVTRCSVKLANGLVGHSYIKGRDCQHAEFAAAFDALFQDKQQSQLLRNTMLEELDSSYREQRQARSKKAAATKVDFFTMVRGEDG